LTGKAKVLPPRKSPGATTWGGDFWAPAAYARRKAPEAFKAKIEALLNDPEIVRSLQ
jgi:hypothetical protein